MGAGLRRSLRGGGIKKSKRVIKNTKKVVKKHKKTRKGGKRKTLKKKLYKKKGGDDFMKNACQNDPKYFEANKGQCIAYGYM